MAKIKLPAKAKTGIPLTNYSSGKICAKFSKDQLIEWATRYSNQEEEVSQDNSKTINPIPLETITSNDILVGIQFRFKENGEDREFLALEQVYVNSANGNLRRLRISDDILDSNCELLYLNEVGSTDAHTSASGLSGLFYNFRNFNFYVTNDNFPNDNTSLVFFPIQDIEFLAKYFEDIFLSGCQVHFGYRAASDTAGEKMSSTDLFTLKLEGKQSPIFNQARLGEQLIETDLPGFSIGAVCPPVWYITSEITSQLSPNLINNLDFIKALVKNIQVAYPTESSSIEIKFD